MSPPTIEMQNHVPAMTTMGMPLSKSQNRIDPPILVPHNEFIQIGKPIYSSNKQLYMPVQVMVPEGEFIDDSIMINK